MLSVEALHSGYDGAPVIRGVSFAVSKGEVLGIVGHNGMGKTTLMRTLMGSLATASGKILFEGAAIEKAPAHQRSRAGIGYTPQGGSGFPGLTVRESLTLAASTPSSRPTKTIDETISKFSRLAPLLERRCGALSGGERQLLALARALIRAPKLLLLDELTEGVQPSVSDEIAEHLAAEQRTESTSMIIADQDLSFVTSLAHRALVVQKGTIAREFVPEMVESDNVFGNLAFL